VQIEGWACEKWEDLQRKKIIFMKIYFVLTCLFMIFFSCRETEKKENDCKNAREILIINRGANKYLMDSAIITDRNALNEYCDLLSQAVPFSGTPNVMSNFGFFELIITNEDNHKQSLDVIYTVYDGIVIRHYNGGYFKQDKFIDYILRNVKDK
jgi:hypothetical protein